MNKSIILLFLIFIVGCDYMMPTVQKSITEKKQLEELQRQNDILERIAVALENKN